MTDEELELELVNRARRRECRFADWLFYRGRKPRAGDMKTPLVGPDESNIDEIFTKRGVSRAGIGRRLL